MKRKSVCPSIQWSRIMRRDIWIILQCWLLTYVSYNLKCQFSSFCYNITKPVYYNNKNQCYSLWKSWLELKAWNSIIKLMATSWIHFKLVLLSNNTLKWFPITLLINQHQLRNFFFCNVLKYNYWHQKV